MRIAPCLRVVAVRYILPLCCGCALHLASEVLPNKVFAKRQALLVNEDAPSGTSGSQHIKTGGTKLQTPLVSRHLLAWYNCSKLSAKAMQASLMTQVQEDVRPNCFYNEETNYFGLPSPEQLAAYNIVVCTCGAAGKSQNSPLHHMLCRACIAIAVNCDLAHEWLQATPLARCALRHSSQGHLETCTF